MTDNGHLPPGFDALWGRREAPRRGPKPGLSIDVIVHTAIEIADAENLAAVSMARVAERLGHTAMSLYRYVRSKDELLALMIDMGAIMHPPPEPVDGDDWRANLERWTVALAALYRTHRWVLEVPLGTQPPIGPGQLTWLDRGLAAMAGTRTPAGVRTACILLLLTYVRGEFRFALDYAQSRQPEDTVPAAQYGTLLRRVVDPRKLPALAEAMAAGVFDGVQELYAEGDLEEQLRFGLPRVLDGIAVLVDHFEREG
jgi:AcrR family transcriptional regulator